MCKNKKGHGIYYTTVMINLSSHTCEKLLDTNEKK